MPENDVEVKEEVNETPQEEKTDPFEEKARELGWRGKEDWDGAEEDFIDAKEFVRRQPLFDKIEHLTKELKKIRQGHEALVDHTKKLKEAEFKRAIDQLKSARKNAILEGETERALAYEEKLEEVEADMSSYKTETEQLNTPPEPEPPPQFVNWKNQNKWYGSDRAMTAFADALGRDLARRGMLPESVLEEVSKEVKKEFSHKFTNPNRSKPSAVESPSRKSAKAEVGFEIPAEDVPIMNKILRAGGITKDEYIAQYKLIHGVK